MTTRWPAKIALIGALSAFGLLHVAAAQEVQTVTVKGNEVYASRDGGRFERLTNDGQTKRLPVWSKEGTRIAFVENAPRNVALAYLHVIDRQGTPLSRILIHPATPGVVQAGMRYVEEVEWLTDTLIAVSGSVNPSTTDYAIVDASTGALVDEFLDDGKGAAFSPDGHHFAYVTGRPHFTPASQRNATVNVDGQAVFPRPGERVVEVSSTLQWSPDSRSVGFIANDPQTGEQKAVVYRLGTSVSVSSLPEAGSLRTWMFWNDEDLFVMSEPPSPREPSKAWKLSAGHGQAIAVAVKAGQAGAFMPAEIDGSATSAAAAAYQASLSNAVRDFGGKYADVWCRGCVLSRLPRRASLTK
jgi:dipeptidyl aminopeptidase/acylaminoacyl peptidase